MEPILTLTMNPTIDVSTTVENVFPEHKLRCGAERHEPGGGGINVTRAITRLGGESTAFHLCGGPTGELLRALLDEAKVVHRPIEVAGWTRQSFTVTETSSGQQYRFVMQGPELTEREWQGVAEQMAQAESCSNLMVVSGSLPLGVPDDFYGWMAGMMRERGRRLLLDTSGHALPAAVKAGVFLIKPSLRELKVFAGGDLEHEPEQEAAAMGIIESKGAEAVVVSLGAAGVLFASKEGCERMRSPTVPVRSKVGAGDSMVAGMALALERGLALRDAVRFGVAAGAAAVMKPGTELCQREDAERLFLQIK